MRGKDVSRAKNVAIVMLGFKWPPLTGLNAKMNKESRMKFETPPTSAPRKDVVAKTPAAVVGVGIGAVAGLSEIQTVRKTSSIVPIPSMNAAFHRSTSRKPFRSKVCL